MRTDKIICDPLIISQWFQHIDSEICSMTVRRNFLLIEGVNPFKIGSIDMELCMRSVKIYSRGIQISSIYAW
jgi:hypothetical protein